MRLFLLHLDESNIFNDTAQLSLSARYFFDESFHKDLFGIISLDSRTNKANIYDCFQNYMEDKNIHFNKIIGLATDGARDFMTLSREKAQLHVSH